jgi:hypothetical protein
MHHPTYYQVMLGQGAQIDIVNQQPTRIFFPRTTTDWNRLPETTTSLQVFSQYHRELPYAAEFQPSWL